MVKLIIILVQVKKLSIQVRLWRMVEYEAPGIGPSTKTTIENYENELFWNLQCTQTLAASRRIPDEERGW